MVLVAGGVYKIVLAKPALAPTAKVHGTVYVLPKEFLVNLREGRLARVSVGLVVEPAEAGGGAPATVAPPEGYGTNPTQRSRGGVAGEAPAQP